MKRRTEPTQETIRTPFHAPNANADAEPWIRTVREECLDHLLIANQAQLRRVLVTYAADCNKGRPHQGLGQRSPLGQGPGLRDGPIHRRDTLGGLLQDYYREAA